MSSLFFYLDTPIILKTIWFRHNFKSIAIIYGEGGVGMYILTIDRRWCRWLLLGAMLFFILLLAISFFAKNDILGVAGEARLLPIYQVETTQPRLAISFDAAWGAEHTLEILDILDDFSVKTTFFLVNYWLEDYPELAKEIVARGHEIGLHSSTHPEFTKLTTDQVIEELEKNAELILSVTGYQPKLFRPPFGDYNDQVISLSLDTGFQPIQWSIDSLDWKDLSADEIVTRVMKDIEQGDIVLFHNNGLHTAEALPIILQQLQERNLQVVPISELLLTGDTYITPDGTQHVKK